MYNLSKVDTLPLGTRFASGFFSSLTSALYAPSASAVPNLQGLGCVRVVHLGRSTRHAISGRVNKPTRFPDGEVNQCGVRVQAYVWSLILSLRVSSVRCPACTTSTYHTRQIRVGGAP